MATQSWLVEYDPDRDFFACLALKHVTSVLSLVGARMLCAACLPHAYAVIHNTLNFHDKSVQVARVALLQILSAYFWSHNADKDAMVLAEESVRVTEVLYGASHRSHSECINFLAEVNMSRRKYEEAADILQKQLTYSPEEQDYEYFETLGTLGQALSLQGKYQDAGKLMCRALSGLLNLMEHKIIGYTPKHSIISLQKDLFENFARQGNWTKFFKSYQKRMERVWHPDWHYNMSNYLAWRFLISKNYSEAESLFHKILDHQTAVLGIENPTTLTTIGDLALIAFEQGRHEEAENNLRFVYENIRKTLEHDHPQTLDAAKSLSICMLRQGRYGEAEILAKDCLKAVEASLGPNQQLIFDLRYTLSNILSRGEKPEEAHQMYLRSLSIADDLEDNQLKDKVLDQIACHMEIQSKWEEAESFRGQELDLWMLLSGQEEREINDGLPQPASQVSRGSNR